MDHFHLKAAGDVPVERVRRHRKVLKLARRLGYDPLDYDDRRIRSRYNLGLARDRSGRFRPLKPLRKWLAAKRRKGDGG